MAIPVNLLDAIEELRDHRFHVTLRCRTPLRGDEASHWSIEVGEPNVLASYGHDQLRKLIGIGERHGLKLAALGPALSLR
jgi:hypothetical protein